MLFCISPTARLVFSCIVGAGATTVQFPESSKGFRDTDIDLSVVVAMGWTVTASIGHDQHSNLMSKWGI